MNYSEIPNSSKRTKKVFIKYHKKEGKIAHTKIKVGEFVFDSKLEAERYEYLRTMEKAGLITDLRPHPKFELQGAFRDSDGVAQRAITYIADFSYTQSGAQIVEDVKSPFTAKDSVFKIKMKMFKRIYPHIKFKVVMYKKSQGGWYAE